MKIKMICVLSGVLISAIALAQERPKFNTINMAGITIGKSGGFGILQTINGLTYKKCFAGIGVGIDYYKNKTIPLFIDLRTSVLKTNLFVFADLGYNFPSHNKPGKETYYYNVYHFFGGAYYELGFGYKIRLTGKSYLLFTSGYSYKKLNDKAGYQCPANSCPVNYSTFEYEYRRVQFKAGISL